MKTIAELAAALGVSRTRLYESPGIMDLPPGYVVKTGPRGGKSGIPDEKFGQAVALLQRMMLEDRDAERDYDLEKARAMKEHYAALREKTKHEVEIGDLVKRSQIERLLSTSLRIVRDRVLEVPTQLAADLAAMDDPHAVQSALDQALADALAGLPETVADALRTG